MNATTSMPRPLAPLSRRRRLVMLALGGYALALISYLLYEVVRPASEGPFVAGSLLGMVVMAAGSIPLYRPAYLGLPKGRDRHLDERQWQRLKQAHVLAYRLLGAVFLIAAFYFYLGYENGTLPVPSTSYAWLTIYMGAVNFIPTLPTMILAWTEPDERD